MVAARLACRCLQTHLITSLPTGCSTFADMECACLGRWYLLWTAPFFSVRKFLLYIERKSLSLQISVGSFLFYSLGSYWINVISSFTLEALEIFFKDSYHIPQVFKLKKKKSPFLQLGLIWNYLETPFHPGTSPEYDTTWRRGDWRMV